MNFGGFASGVVPENRPLLVKGRGYVISVFFSCDFSYFSLFFSLKVSDKQLYKLQGPLCLHTNGLQVTNRLLINQIILTQSVLPLLLRLLSRAVCCSVFHYERFYTLNTTPFRLLLRTGRNCTLLSSLVCSRFPSHLIFSLLFLVVHTLLGSRDDLVVGCT